MRKLLSLLLLLLTGSLLLAQTDGIDGTVMFEDKPVVNAKVENLSKEVITLTDAEGKFAIDAKFKDKIRISHAGKRDFIFTLIQTKQSFTIHMSSEEVELDEVVVAQRKRSALARERRKKQEFYSAFGTRNFPGVSFANIITKEDIWASDVDLLSILKRIPRLRVFNEGSVNPEVVLARAFNSRFPTLGRSTIDSGRDGDGHVVSWDVDGLITKQVPLWLNVDQIEKMVILDRPNQTILYGSQGGAGVVVINTTLVSDRERIEALDKMKEERRFKERMVSYNTVNTGELGYISKLKSADDPFLAYDDQASYWGHHPHFYVDVHDFFNAENGYGEYNDQILDKIKTTFPDDMQALRLLAFKLEEKNSLAQAREVYRMIAKNKPNSIQVLRDLANIEAKLGNKILSDRLYLATISKIILSESAELADMLDFVRSEMNYHSSKFIPNDYEASDIEIIVEWDDPTAEFELQFINEEGYYDSWKHTRDSNPVRINNESIYDVSLQRFYIDSLEDLWNVNIKYFGNESLTTPTFMKVTIRNTRKKQEKIKVFRLKAKDLSQNFARIARNHIMLN